MSKNVPVMDDKNALWIGMSGGREDDRERGRDNGKMERENSDQKYIYIYFLDTCIHAYLI